MRENHPAGLLAPSLPLSASHTWPSRTLLKRGKSRRCHSGKLRLLRSLQSRPSNTWPHPSLPSTLTVPKSIPQPKPAPPGSRRRPQGLAQHTSVIKIRSQLKSCSSLPPPAFPIEQIQSSGEQTWLHAFLFVCLSLSLAYKPLEDSLIHLLC